MSAWITVVAQPSNAVLRARVDGRCPSPGQDAGWDEALSEALDFFVYTQCESCGYDLEDHTVTPGPFGQPFLYCEKGEDR